MTKPEIRMTKEIQDPNTECPRGECSGSSFDIRHSSLFRASTFGFRHFLVLTACIAFAQQPAAPLPDEEDLPEPDDSWDFTNRPGLNATMREMLDKLIPEGRSHEGLRYPIYSDGKAKGAPRQEAEFKSERVSRLDDTWVQFTKAIFQSFGDPAAPDTATRTVILEDAIYDLRYDLIFSNAPVKIEDKAMSIQSGAMLYDRTTGLTIFSGGVELYPHESAETPDAAAPTPAPAPVIDKPPTNPGTP